MTDITTWWKILPMYVKLASNGNSTSTYSKLVISSTIGIALPFYHYGCFHQSFQNPHCHHQDQLETGFHGNRSGLSSWSVDAEQNSPSSNPSLTLLSSCHPVIIWVNIIQHFQWAIDKATWGSTSNITFLLHRHLESVAASLFVWNCLSWQKVSIRWRDPNNNTDSEARCLVYGPKGL